jgi:hypothetical protein
MTIKLWVDLRFGIIISVNIVRRKLQQMEATVEDINMFFVIPVVL